MPLSEDIHATTHEYLQQHDVEWRHEHPGGHTSWRESTRMKFMNIQMGYSKMRSESSEYMWETTGAFINIWRIKIALESYFGKHAKEAWEKIRMDPDMHPVLLDTNNLDVNDGYLPEDLVLTASPYSCRGSSVKYINNSPSVAIKINRNVHIFT